MTLDLTSTEIMEVPGSYERVRQAMSDLANGSPVYEIHERGANYEQEAACGRLCVSESFSFSPSFDWMRWMTSLWGYR